MVAFPKAKGKKKRPDARPLKLGARDARASFEAVGRRRAFLICVKHWQSSSFAVFLATHLEAAVCMSSRSYTVECQCLGSWS